MKTEKERITAADVIKGLRSQFPEPAFCLLEQVADGTGARQHRWADAVAMSVWPSRGYILHGVEVKVNRYDWLSEVRNPKKSSAVQKYCDYWWIAVSDASIVQPGELPDTWGLTVLNGKGTKVVTPAPKLEPATWDVEFVASVFRNMARASTVEIENAVSKAYSKGREEGAEYQRTHSTDQYSSLKSSVDEFESKSGVKIDSWDGKRIGEAVHVVIGLKRSLEVVRRAAETCGEIQKAMTQIVNLAELEAVDVGNRKSDEAAT